MRRSLGIFFGRVERAIYCDVIGGGAKKKSIVYFYFIYMTYTTLILVSNSKAKTKSRCSIFFPTTSLKAVVGCLPLLMLLSASSSRLFLHCNLIIFKSDYSEIFFISQMMMRLTKYNTTQQKNTLKDACVCMILLLYWWWPWWGSEYEIKLMIKIINIIPLNYQQYMNFFCCQYQQHVLSVGRGCVFTPKPPFSLATHSHT